MTPAPTWSRRAAVPATLLQGRAKGRAASFHVAMCVQTSSQLETHTHTAKSSQWGALPSHSSLRWSIHTVLKAPKAEIT